MRIMGQQRPCDPLAATAGDKENVLSPGSSRASVAAKGLARSPRDVEISPFKRIQAAGSHPAMTRSSKNLSSALTQVQAQQPNSPAGEASRSSSTPRVLSAKVFNDAGAASASSKVRNSDSPFKQSSPAAADKQRSQTAAEVAASYWSVASPAPAPRSLEQQGRTPASGPPGGFKAAAEDDEGIRASKVLSAVIQRALNHEGLEDDSSGGESSQPICLVTCDRQTLTISRDIAMRSLTLKWKAAHEIGKERGGDTVRLTDESCTLNMLMKITKYLAILSSAEHGHAPLASLLAVENEVAGKNESEVFQLLMASNYLEIPELTCIACERLQKFQGKHPASPKTVTLSTVGPETIAPVYQPVPDLQAHLSDATSLSASSLHSSSSSFNLSHSFNSARDTALDDEAFKITADLVLSANPLESVYPLRHGEDANTGGARQLSNPLESAFPQRGANSYTPQITSACKVLMPQRNMHRAQQDTSSQRAYTPSNISSYQEVQMPSQAPYDEPAPIKTSSPFRFVPPREKVPQSGDLASFFATPPRAAVKREGGDVAPQTATPPHFVSEVVAKLNAKAMLHDDAVPKEDVGGAPSPGLQRGAQVELRVRTALSAATQVRQDWEQRIQAAAGSETKASPDTNTTSAMRSAKKASSAEPARSRMPQQHCALTQERALKNTTTRGAGADEQSGVVRQLALAYSVADRQTGAPGTNNRDGQHVVSKSSSAPSDGAEEGQKQDQRSERDQTSGGKNGNDGGDRKDDRGRSMDRSRRNNSSGNEKSDGDDNEKNNGSGGSSNKDLMSPKEKSDGEEDPEDKGANTECDLKVEISHKPTLSFPRKESACTHGGIQNPSPVQLKYGASMPSDLSSPFAQKHFTDNDLYDVMKGKGSVAPPSTPIQDSSCTRTPTQKVSKTKSRLVDVEEGGHGHRGKQEWRSLLNMFSGKAKDEEEPTFPERAGPLRQPKEPGSSKQQLMQWENKPAMPSESPKAHGRSLGPDVRTVQNLQSLLSKTNETLEQARANLLKLQADSLQSSPRSPRSPERADIRANQEGNGQAQCTSKGSLVLELQLEARSTVEKTQDDHDLEHQKIVTHDGDTYMGTILQKEWHGTGICKYSNGDAYTGEWKQGKRHGWGRMEWADGNIYQGVWRHDLVCPGFREPRPVEALTKDSPPHPTANMPPASTYMERVRHQRLQDESHDKLASVIPVDTPLRNSRGRNVTKGVTRSAKECVEGKENSSRNSVPTSPTRRFGEKIAGLWTEHESLVRQVQPNAASHNSPGLMGVVSGFTDAVFDVGDVIFDIVRTAEDDKKARELAQKRPFVPPRLTKNDSYFLAL